MRNNNTINHFKIKNFVHLGVPNQYRNFLKWSNIFLSNFEKSLKLNYQTVMLMAGKGKRLKTLKEKKSVSCLQIKDKKSLRRICKAIFPRFYLEKEGFSILGENFFK